MKLKFTIYDLRFTIWKKSATEVSANPQSAIGNRQSGVALVITLILLSVTLLMAVAFLLISQREQAASHTQADDTTARLAADAALQKAEAQIIANIMSSPQPNPYNFGLIVSTNYINYLGFQTGIANSTNVNYYYNNDPATPLTGNDALQNLANLFYSPRLPVFVPTNTAGSNDFRFYLDLNRNGYFEQNIDEIGDPEWIGILERPDVSYGADNKGLSRFAFIAIPIGNSLDLNAIHNQVFDEHNALVNPPPIGDAYFRNQGVGSWEINLAAFLADLNTNEWDNSSGFYNYSQPVFQNTGIAFDDARALLAYRYANNYQILAPANNLFQNAANIFPNDFIDGYSDGILQTNVPLSPDNDDSSIPWAGADNTNHFFNLPTDLFDTNKTAIGASGSANFTTRLMFASTNNNGSTANPPFTNYDRTTFYRLLSQLGTDSEPESDKMNLNYDNLDIDPATGTASETNFMPWTPIAFFTNAADRMLRAYTTRWATGYMTNNLGFAVAQSNLNFIATFNGSTNAPFYVTNSFGIANIPVLINGRFVYTPAVQRVLQQAANIYDGTTTNFYPSVFRPEFFRDSNNNVFIVGYQQVASVVNAADVQLARPIEVTALPVGLNVTNVYGVPWIIGAKKYLPNFNEFAFESSAQVTRKLEVVRNTNASPPMVTLTNQMYIMSVSNWLGVELWNSYINDYTNRVPNAAITFLARANTWISLTNDDPAFLARPQIIDGGFTNAFGITSWPGSGVNLRYSGTANRSSFFLPVNGVQILLTNSVYYYTPFSYTPPPPNNIQSFTGPTFIPQNLDPSNYLDTTGIQPFPHFGLAATNRLQVFILDRTNVIDYVQLGGLDSGMDIYSKVADPYDWDFWSTNFSTGNTNVPDGVINQIEISKRGGTIPLPEDGDIGANWSTTPIPGIPSYDFSDPVAQQKYFLAFFASNSRARYTDSRGNTYTITNTRPNIQAPFTISRTVVGYTSWQANDPLVHYLASDLNFSGADNGLQSGDTDKGNPQALTDLNLGKLNDRYQPWGRAIQITNNSVDLNPYSLAYKDPLVWQSDDWNFPNNKLPTEGWLGRVHRGTPWQTVYLKSTNILDYAKNPVSGPTTWFDWTGNHIATDQENTAPIADRALFDLFTTAFNDNATRGQLSVNVGSTAGSHNLAAWSALLSGIAVPNVTNSSMPTIISPAGPGTNSPLWQLVNAIDTTRNDPSRKNPDGLTGVFERKGDILATPQLSERSPFIDLTQTNLNSDAIYEWLPQQVMSLLRVGSPRYVIYSWGQTLKPARDSIYSGGGPFFGMITNYQIMAESATRAVVRIEGAPTNTHAVVESFNILPP